MLSWLSRLSAPSIAEVDGALETLRAYWIDGKNVDLMAMRERLWKWVDSNGGPRVTDEMQMLYGRMVLCLAYEDNRELEDMGFFEDLLNNFGIPRSEINKYDSNNLPVPI